MRTSTILSELQISFLAGVVSVVGESYQHNHVNFVIPVVMCLSDYAEELST